MTRQSHQQGYVSDAIRSRYGIIFKIRYRVRTAEGKWKHKSETLYGVAGKKAARAELAQRIQAVSGQKPNVSDLTLRQFVDAYWKPYLDRKRIKPSTRMGYQCIMDRHLFPNFGELLLKDIAPLHMEQFLQDKMRTELSPKTNRNLLGLLQGIFSLAVDNDLISRSPIRNRHKPVVQRQEKPVWTEDQMREIIAAEPQAYRGLFTCVAIVGVRLGELLGLKWKHVDFESRTLRIEQSLWQGQIVTPKTKRSTRLIAFGEILSGVLTQHLQSSRHIGPEDFVFCKPDGFPPHPDVLRRDVLYPVLDRLGIPRPARAAGFHTFRHSAASIINAKTGNLKLAQKLLGHSNLSTTADIYTHTSIEAEREAAVAVEQAVFGGSVPSCSQNREQEP